MENIKKTPDTANPESARRPLYPERPSSGIESKLRQLADFESGKAEKIPLSPEEREEISALEDTLGSTLEKIFEITPKTASLYADYLSSDEGRADFEAIAGKPLGSYGSSAEDAMRALYAAAPDLAAIDTKKLSGLCGRSRDWNEQKLFERLSASMLDDGGIRVGTSDNPIIAKIQLTPEKTLAKLSALRQFKSQLRGYEESLESRLAKKSASFRSVLSGIINIYRIRVNHMLADNASAAFAIEQKRKSLGDAALSEDEVSILKLVSGTEDPEKNLSRYDKFINGAATGYRSDQQRVQVDDALIRFAEEFEGEYVSSLVLRREQIEAAGLDQEKLFSETIPAAQVENLAQEVLDSYGLLSEHNAESYSPDRPGPAPDGKWQFVTSDASRTMSIHGKQKVIHCSRKNQSAATLIPVTLAHEIEGHVLQYENKSKIPLRLFKKLGSGRTDIFAECGAMSNQDAVSRQAFGYSSPTHPHYIRAMARKLAGGDYAECLEAFYESALKGPRLQQTIGSLSREDFRKQAEKNLKLAINRTKRLFCEGADFSSREASLSNSKDTVYLEQVRLFQKLKEYGLEKYAFVLGADLNTLIFLMKSGFLDPSDIQQPKYQSLEIWKRMREEYLKSTPS